MASNPLGSGPFLVFQKDADGSRKGNVDDGMELPLAIAKPDEGCQYHHFNFKEVGQVSRNFPGIYLEEGNLCDTQACAAMMRAADAGRRPEKIWLTMAED